MEEQIADIATKEKLNGFKVLGVFPFYLSYISVKTKIKLCRVQDAIYNTGSEPKASDFDNYEIQSKAVPLIVEYCTIGLINSRFLGFLLKPFIKRKLYNSGHREILGIYTKLLELSEPAFFFTYWKHLKVRDHTLLSAEKPS